MSDDKVVSLRKKKHNDEPKKEGPVYCSFCNRPNHLVAKMIQGPGVNICSECTMIAVQYFILEDRIPSEEAQKILDAFWGSVK